MSKQIKNKDQYEALREKGMSKEKAARIANADVDHDSRAYEDRSRTELYELAKELDIQGRSKMDKSELIDAIRNS